MKSRISSILVLILILTPLVATACSSARQVESPTELAQPAVTVSPIPPTSLPPPTVTPTLEPPEPAITRITIDGDPNEWEPYEVLKTDDQADNKHGGFDVRSIRAFANNAYLYVLIDAYGEMNDYVQIDMDVDVNGDYQTDYVIIIGQSGYTGIGDLTVDPSIWGGLSGAQVAIGSAVEFRMPLSRLNAGPDLLIPSLHIMNGTCCESEWLVTDQLGQVRVQAVFERELTLPDRYQEWIAASFEGPASEPLILHDISLDGARSVHLNAEETRAYVTNEFSGEFGWVDIDPASPDFGAYHLLAGDLFVLNDAVINREETLGYVSRESSPRVPEALNLIMQVDLATGNTSVISDALRQPTNLVLGEEETDAYVVDLGREQLCRIDLATGTVVETIARIKRAFAVAIDPQAHIAYVASEPAGPGDYPHGSLYAVDLATQSVSVIASQAIYGATGLTLSADGKYLFATEFGPEGGCGGFLSVFNVDPQSENYGQKTVLLSDLCGAHDIKLNQAQTMAFFVEVDGSRLSVIRVDLQRLD